MNSSKIARSIRSVVRLRLSVGVSAAFLAFIILVAVLAPYIAPYPPNEMSPSDRFEFVSLEHFFGTDRFGRDLFSRVIYGARFSLFIGFTSVLLSAFVGSALGTIAGSTGGVLGALIMRTAEVLLGFPGILTALVLIAIFGVGLWKIIIAIAFFQVPQFVRLVNSFVLYIKEETYVEAARAIGAGSSRTIIHHIVPQFVGPLIVQITLFVPSSIMVASGLSFLGLGVSPPTPEWGLMIKESYEYLREAPWTTFFPGVFLALVVVSFNLLGDFMTERLDPRLRGTRGRW